MRSNQVSTIFFQKKRFDVSIKERDQILLVYLILHQSSSACGQFVKRSSGNSSAVSQVI